MSHFRKCTVELESAKVNVALVMQAMQELARELGVRTTDVVRDFYGNRRKVLIALEGLYGVYVSPEEGLVLIGDEYGKRIPLDEFKRLLVRTYTVIAMRRELESMGFSVQVGKAGSSVIIHGVRS
jgi:hypothetical protein